MLYHFMIAVLTLAISNLSFAGEFKPVPELPGPPPSIPKKPSPTIRKKPPSQPIPPFPQSGPSSDPFPRNPLSSPQGGPPIVTNMPGGPSSSPQGPPIVINMPGGPPQVDEEFRYQQERQIEYEKQFTESGLNYSLQCNAELSNYQNSLQQSLSISDLSTASQIISAGETFINNAEKYSAHVFRYATEEHRGSPFYEAWKRSLNALSEARAKLNDMKGRLGAEIASRAEKVRQAEIVRHLGLGRVSKFASEAELAHHTADHFSEQNIANRTRADELKSFRDKNLNKLGSDLDARVSKTKAMSEKICFPGETPISVKDDSARGYRSAPISSIHVGDAVVSCNLENKGTCEYGQVNQVITNTTDRLVNLLLNGQVLKATSNHPFYDVDREKWVEAQDLRVGDHLQAISGEVVTIDDIDIEKGQFTVYNLDVEGNHNYYACDVLVHNCALAASIAVPATRGAIKLGPLARGAMRLGGPVGLVVVGGAVVAKNLYDDYRSAKNEEDSAAGNETSKPKENYENPGHHDPNSRGPNPYNPTKSVLPKNHKELWDKSVESADGTRWTKVGNGKKAEYHRFQNDGNGNWHWNGSTGGVTKGGQNRPIRPNDVPKEIRNLPGD